MNKLLQRFLNEKVIVAVRTEDEWIQFMEMVESKTNLKWSEGQLPTKYRKWKRYKKETAIAVACCIQFATCDHYKNEGREIIEFQDLLKGEEKIMTPAEKLRFLADRAEDGKEFHFNAQNYRFRNGALQVDYSEGWEKSRISFNGLFEYTHSIKLKPQWTFTDDEKAILRNLPSKYHFIARDSNEALWIYTKRPVKSERVFHAHVDDSETTSLSLYPHLFKSIQWSDDEACEFREYI